MKYNLNTLRKVLTCFALLLLLLMFGHKDAFAYLDKSSTNITLDSGTKHIEFDFTMPKDGTIKLNLSVKDEDTVPGSLTFAIQTGNSKIKEIKGITSLNGITDMEIELSKGEYEFYYELNNASGDLSNTSLRLNCQTEILPTIPDNISELSTYSITSFDEITKDGYDEIKFGDKYLDLILPFTADQAGGMIISMAQKTGSYKEIEAGIFKDKECTLPVGDNFILEAVEDSVTIARTISDKGTYYIKFTLQEEAPVGISSFKVKLYAISDEARTLTMKKTTVAFQNADNKKIIYKINVKNEGALTFALTPYDNSNGGSAYFQLLDKNKKKITKNSYVTSIQNDDMTFDPVSKYYTVTKGTYYLQIDAECMLYELKSTFYKSASRQAGAKKTNAKLLKIGGKAAEGHFTIADKTTKVDWYKFNISSDQYARIFIGYELDGDMEYEVIDSKGKIIFNSSNGKKCLEGCYYHWGDYQYSKGYYFIKLYKASKSSSYSYAITVLN